MNGRRLVAAAVGLASVLSLSASAALVATAGRSAVPSDAAGASLTLMSGVCRPPGTGHLQLGITHDQHSLARSDATAVKVAGEAELAQTPIYQNQYLMGWGVGNPEPSPGAYDWASLDARMAMIEQTGGTPVITLAGAPDWMKGGAAGQTRWSQLLQAPNPDHFDDFAQLAATTARRFPQVKHYLVWSEMKGFWDTQRNAWDVQGYTDLYNKVYTALKSVDPSIQVGGPYIVMTSWQNPRGVPSALDGVWGHLDARVADSIDYWLAHKIGADMIVVDGGSGSRDNPHPSQPQVAARKFGDLTRWLRARTDLPVWWSEMYPSVQSSRVADDAAKSAATIDAYRELTAAGAATAWIWSPQEFPNFDFAGLWQGSKMTDPGRQSALGRAWPALAAELAVVPECSPDQGNGTPGPTPAELPRTPAAQAG